MQSHEQSRSEGWCLSAILLLLPFEPRRPTLAFAGLQVTLLEAAAGLGLAWLALLTWRRLPVLLRHPPAPLAFLLGYAVAHVVSAAFASDHPDLAAKFSLRMLVMAGFAVLVASLPVDALRRSLAALVVAAVLVSVLSIVEGAGNRGLDPFLDWFREMPFNVAGSRRASAASEYPNLSAAFLMYGLLSVGGLGTGARRPLRLVTPLAAVLSAGLLYTYSRGALVATGCGLLTLSAALFRGSRSLALAPLATLGVLLMVSIGFASGGEVFRLRLGSEGTQRWYSARYEPAEPAFALRPGEDRVTDVRVTNSGIKTWAVAESFHLSYHWFDRDRRRLRDGGRTALPHDLRPGESVRLSAEVRAPEEEGTYLLFWDMVHEHTTWFSGQGVQPGRAIAVVSSAGDEGARAPDSSESSLLSVAWHPGRLELWRLALKMWRDSPVTGVGSDNFRQLYGQRAARPFWDARIFANNTLLEAAATTGTLGLLALTGTIVSSLWVAACALAALRRSAAAVPVAAALLALIVGLTAHGAVDYVLAFTGHYLFFGFVVGAVSALSLQCDGSQSTNAGPSLPR